MNKNSFEFFSTFRNNPAYQDLDKPIIIADDLRSPENMGSVLRLAGNIGASRTIFVSDIAQQFRKYKINRTATGSGQKTDWEIVSKKGVNIKKLIPEDYRLIAVETSPNAKNLFEVTLPHKCAFLIGNERGGISDELMNQVIESVFIPIPGLVSSLNVTHALSIALFEWLRQRKIEY